MTTEPRLYADLASWFHLLTSPSDYAEEAAAYAELLRAMADGEVRTVLELGSGGGNNASHMKAQLELTLVDRSEQMLALSRTLNPELEHRRGDMCGVRLGATFDAIFVHDAVSYLTTEAQLRSMAETAAVHCRDGGALLVVPDYVRDDFAESTTHGGHDGSGRALRYVEWTWDPDPADTTYVSDFAYLLREGESVWVEHDRHVCGLFATGVWLDVLGDAGFAVEHRPIEWSDGSRSPVFAGRKSA